MTRARAPGKLVLSGAYSVLHGAPALVAAVDRYVIADASRPAERITDEVRAALGGEPVPWFDASALRRDGKKLGLGSSAAILVASLAARELALQGELPDAVLCDAVFERALTAHRAAQGGGSGSDVAASAYGGVVAVRRDGDALDVERVALPAGLGVEVWWCQADASTPAFLARIRELAARDANEHARRIAEQSAAAEAALAAVRAADAARLIAALQAQARALAALGQAAGIPIVTADVAELAQAAAREGAAFLPAGAGGGDIACFVAERPASPAFAECARARGLLKLELALGARGVHASASQDVK